MIDNKANQKIILVVEDTPEILQATSRVLRKADYEVIEASTGGECMDQIHREPPDLVLLDIMLPDADGIELAEMIKSNPRRGNPFVILISSKKISSEDRVRGLTIGADGYLTRPISNRDLVAHVDAFFRIKAIEKTLREDNENLRIILESIGDAVVTADQMGRIVTLNLAAERLCGWTREKAHGTPFAEVFRLVDEATLQDREDLVQRVLQEGTVIELTRPTLLVSKKGEKTPVADSAAPIRSATGSVVGVVLVFQDMTVQCQNEKEIARVTEDWELIFQSIGHPAWILNPDYTLLRVNRLAADLLEKLPQELVGKKCYDVFHACQGPPEGCPLSTSILSGHTEQHEMEIEAFARVFICSCTPVVENGQVEKIIHIATDITERKRHEQELSAALSEKEVLLREVHHRVKNNLAAIISLMDMQRRNLKDAHDQDVLTELSNRIRSMSLVHEKLYRADSLASIDFQNYTQALTSHLRTTFGSPGIICQVDATGVTIPLDFASPCGLIVNELVSNALKHAFPDGNPRPGNTDCRILVRLHRDKDTYTLTVADNGIGWLPGFDWKKTRTLGMTLVRMLGQHQLGGQYVVDQNNGTRITLTFTKSL